MVACAIGKSIDAPLVNWQPVRLAQLLADMLMNIFKG
jgi:hypothetical protein